MTDGELSIRRARPEDDDAVLDLLASSLGWRAGSGPQDSTPDADLRTERAGGAKRDDTFKSFFKWKHELNPFGRSPAWVAVDAGRVVGFRTFLRWQFEHPDGRTRRAVRAVDTATAPDYQGRGVFRRLTLQAVDDLREDGLDFVFNTPNDKSRPGYLKMGWLQLGRVGVEAHIAGLRSAGRMLRARVPAERWSIPVDAGVPVHDLLRDPAAAAVLSRRPCDTSMRTARTIPFLEWRYGYDRFHYRALPVGGDLAAGFVVFRVRRRGGATEATVCELVRGSETVRMRDALRAVVRETGADYAIVAGHAPLRDRVAPLPRQGPILTFRPLADDVVAHLSDFDLSLGDVEAL